MGVIFLITGIVTAFFTALGLILVRLYKRSSKEVSFVRTGFGGQRVILNGGALVFPVLHEVIPVNMQTLRLSVQRANEQALITKDRMRVDVIAEFYVRVKPTTDSISNAAQTLGHRTMEPNLLKELIEGKFVDALRAVAAEMLMKELHEQRVDFVQKVQQVVSEDLLKNGLELEAVSLTGMDQTAKSFFNPDNAFDAEGLTLLTKEIEERKKRRNEIEQETKIAIQKQNLLAEQESLALVREAEYSRLEQEREIAIRKAAQQAEIAQQQAQKEQEAEQAKIKTKQQIAQSEIISHQAVESERIATEKRLKEEEIEKLKCTEILEQDKSIAILKKSKDDSLAAAEAAKARLNMVQEEERVKTAKEVEVAMRSKQIELIEAQKAAEREALSITIRAKAEKNAALDKAEAVRTDAGATAEKTEIAARAQANATITQSEADEKRFAVEAKGKQALNEASNILSSEQIAMQIRLALIENLPNIIMQSVKPLENIEGIKIMQVDGIGGGNSLSKPMEKGTPNLADQVVASALSYRAQAPLIDQLMAEIGIKGNSLNGLTKPVIEDGQNHKS